MAEDLTTIWVSPTGGSGSHDGTTYAKAFTMEEAINWMNSELNQPLTEDVDIYVAKGADSTSGIDYTITSDYPEIEITGNAYAHLYFSGRDSSGNSTEVVSDGGGSAFYVFGSSGVCEYFIFRDFSCQNMKQVHGDDDTQGALLWFPSHFRNCLIYKCYCTSSWHGLAIGQENGAPFMATAVRCCMKEIVHSAYDYGVHGGVTSIECVNVGFGGNEGWHGFEGGGTAMRCISTGSGGNAFFRQRDVIACTMHNTPRDGIDFDQDSLSLSFDNVIVDVDGVAVRAGNEGWYQLYRTATHDVALRIIFGFQTVYDTDNPNLGGPPFVDPDNGNLGLNASSGSDISNLGFSLPEHTTDSYHDLGAAESQCDEPDTGGGPFTGTVLNRSVN